MAGPTSRVPGPSTSSARKGSSDPKTQIFNLLRNANEESKRKRQRRPRFHGVILYTAVIDYDTFSDMYDESFVKTIYDDTSQKKGSSKPLITSSIVFIEDLCSCLPAIKNPKFFEEIGKITGKNLQRKNGATKGRSIVDDLKTQLNIKSNPLYIEDFNRILRYPIAYSKQGSSISPGAMDTVLVEFPREYDFSKCKIIQTTNQKQ